ncbi:MAG: hypothetical protein ACLP70_05640 [Streptosporangiaceae bacterium]
MPGAVPRASRLAGHWLAGHWVAGHWLAGHWLAGHDPARAAGPWPAARAGTAAVRPDRWRPTASSGPTSRASRAAPSTGRSVPAA